MAVPKKRTSHAKQGQRRSCWKATMPTLSTCTNCGSPKHSHAVCQNCGYHKGVFYQAKFIQNPA